MASSKGGSLEKVRRGLRTALFMLTMLASLLMASAPALVALADVVVAVVLTSRLTGVGHEGSNGIKGRIRGYGFRTSLIDIPVVSVVRSLIITCVYALSDGPCLSTGLYLPTVTLTALASVLILSIKTVLFSPPSSDIGPRPAPPSLPAQHHHHKIHKEMPVLFISCLVFALGHIVVAYRTSCRAKKKLLFHSRADVESVLAIKKIPRSPIPHSKSSIPYYSKSDSESRRRASIILDDQDIPISCLADSDSQFLSLHGLSLHFKHYIPKPLRKPSNPNSSSTDSLQTPLLSEDETETEMEGMSVNSEKSGVVLVHGFGGGVFSWRHISKVLARQVGCSVVAFDRPGWGLTSRPRRKDWEERSLANPYRLESQVDLLISFCKEMGFSKVVFVGHDDGGLLALKAAERLKSSPDSSKLEVKGVVVVSGSLSREVVPGFARILLHTPLGKKHMVRPLLRTEITQVINRRAWFDPTKLTSEVVGLYKTPLFVEGWDEALHEIGRLSFASVLSPKTASELLKSIDDLPVLVVAGAEDLLVSLKSSQIMASKLKNSRLVAISGCGHLPHEECPKTLLWALSPFISRLISMEESLQIH